MRLLVLCLHELCAFCLLIYAAGCVYMYICIVYTYVLCLPVVCIGHTRSAVAASPPVDHQTVFSLLFALEKSTHCAA